ncbi:toxin regulator [Paraclostridium sordellii]|uniref:toxin regulator n=1 Tax=Paraclostridium sordellii TaxID=1505 RepID=UPI0030D48224
MSDLKNEKGKEIILKIKNLFTGKLGVGIITFIVGFIVASVAAPQCSLDHDSKITNLNSQLKEHKNQLKEKNGEIETLNAKVSDAEPWFKMGEEEQRKIEEENARIEAERKAQEEAEKKAAEEEAARKAEEERIAKENAEKNKYENGASYNEIARNPDNHLLSVGKFKGKVVQVMEGDKNNNLRVAVDGDYDKMLLVEYDPKIVSQRILEDDYITVYGVNMGIYSYTSTMGAKISIPSMLADKIDM